MTTRSRSSCRRGWRTRAAAVVLLLGTTLIGFGGRADATSSTSASFPTCRSYQIGTVGIAYCTGKQYPQHHRVVIRCGDDPWTGWRIVFGPWTLGTKSAASCVSGPPVSVTYELQPSLWWQSDLR